MSLKKIAEMVGVSPSTVSRVLNNPDHRCADESLKEKIIKAARTLEYTPNEVARNLKYGKGSLQEQSHVNILVTRGEYDPFYSQVLRIIEIYALKQNFLISNIWYNSSFSDFTKSDTADVRKALDEMFDKSDAAANSLIILGKCSEKGIQELKKQCKNIVSINRNAINISIDEVICDGSKIAAAAVEYLISLGHRKIGYVGDSTNESRFVGYQNTMFKYNINIDLSYVYSNGLGYDWGRTAFEYYSKLPDPPTAIYCSNDITALGMLNYMNKTRSKFYRPSVISSDNLDESQFSSPMLTTVDIPKELMVRYALGLLKDRINGGHREKIKIEFEGQLIIRESCSNVNNSMQIEYYI